MSFQLLIFSLIFKRAEYLTCLFSLSLLKITANFLMSLAEQEETIEVSIHDFIPSSISVFTKMFVCRDSFQVFDNYNLSEILKLIRLLGLNV